MRSTTRMQLAWLLLLAPWALGAQRGPIPKDWQEFVSQQGGYVAYFPKSWHVLPPPLPILYISSFPPSRAVRAVIVPENGATIAIAPARSGIHSTEQWIRGDTAAPHLVRSRGSLTVQRPEPSPPLQVAEVVYESIEGPDTASWYFDLSGHLLVANLSYWKSDRHEEEYRQVLREMVRTIVALPR